jgi:hypothetical protein
MRKLKWLAAGVVALGASVPALAQVNTASFGGIDPRQVRGQLIDTSHTAAPIPIAQPQIFNHTFSLANFLPNISKFSGGTSPVLGMSQFPTADGMPGLEYLKAFGFRRPRGFRPPE